MATCNIEALLEAGKCFSCLTPEQRTAIELQLLCEILATGGGGAACESIETPVLSDFNNDASGPSFDIAFDHGDNPVAEFEIWRSNYSGSEQMALQDTIASTEVSYTDGAFGDGEIVAWQVRYKNGSTFGPYSLAIGGALVAI